MAIDSTKPLKVSVSLCLDEIVIQQIRELAEKEDRSFSKYVNKVLREHINKCDKD